MFLNCEDIAKGEVDHRNEAEYCVLHLNDVDS